MSLFPVSYVALDFETTARNPRECGIVEVAVARVEQGHIVDSWSTLANPGVPCDAGAFETHGIAQAEIDAATPLVDILPELVAGWLADGLPVVAYNGDTFDRLVLEANAARCGLALPALTWVDPLPIARRMFPGRGHKLGQVGSAVGVFCEPGELHRAAADVRLLVGVVEAMRAIAAAPPPPVAVPAPSTAMAAPVPPPPNLATLPDKARAALAPKQATIQTWIAKADDLPCETDEDEVRVLDAMAKFRDLAKQVEKLRLVYTDEIGKQKRAIEADYRTFALKPIEGAIERLEAKRRPLALRRAQEAAAERARLAREAEAIAMAERERVLAEMARPDLALEAALSGDADAVTEAAAVADAVMDAANDAADQTYEATIATAAAIAPAPVRGTFSTAHDKPVWRVKVLLPRLVPAQYCSPDLAKLQAAIDAANGDITIPGVEFEVDVVTTNRARRG